MKNNLLDEKEGCYIQLKLGIDSMTENEFYYKKEQSNYFDYVSGTCGNLNYA